MPAIDFRELKAQISMQDVLTLLEFVPTSRSGSQVRGACPLHASHKKTGRTFSANIDQHTFQCFKCGAAGNHIDLWAKATRQSIYQAALDLCNRLNRAVPRLSGTEKRNQ